VNTVWGIVIPVFSLLPMLTVMSRIMHRCWLAPGPFFAGVWSFYILIPMIGAPDFYISWKAVFAIFMAVLAVNFGSFFGLCLAALRANRRLASSNHLRLVRYLTTLIILGTISGLISIGITLSELGQDIRTLLSLNGLLEAAAQNSIARYQQGYTPPRLARVLVTGTYFGALAGGLLFTISKSRSRRLLAFFPFLPALLVTVVMTIKASILFCAILWIASYLASGILVRVKGGHQAWVSGILKGSVALGLMGAIMLFVQLARYGNTEDIRHVIEVLRVTFFGYFAAFSTWIDSNIGNPGAIPRWGAFSFAGVYDLLGISTRELGIFGGQTVDVGDSYTNVYTMFRSLIEDFTSMGTLILLLIVGFVTGYAFGRVRKGIIGYLPFLTMFYALTMWSHVTVLFAYNTFILAFGLWWISLIFTEKTSVQLK